MLKIFLRTPSSAAAEARRDGMGENITRFTEFPEECEAGKFHRAARQADSRHRFTCLPRSERSIDRHPCPSFPCINIRTDPIEPQGNPSRFPCCPVALFLTHPSCDFGIFSPVCGSANACLFPIWMQYSLLSHILFFGVLKAVGIAVCWCARNSTAGGDFTKSIS